MEWLAIGSCGGKTRCLQHPLKLAIFYHGWPVCPDAVALLNQNKEIRIQPLRTKRINSIKPVTAPYIAPSRGHVIWGKISFRCQIMPVSRFLKCGRFLFPRDSIMKCFFPPFFIKIGRQPKGSKDRTGLGPCLAIILLFVLYRKWLPCYPDAYNLGP
jgi:hypothetical protein